MKMCKQSEIKGLHSSNSLKLIHLESWGTNSQGGQHKITIKCHPFSFHDKMDSFLFKLLFTIKCLLCCHCKFVADNITTFLISNNVRITTLFGTVSG